MPIMCKDVISWSTLLVFIFKEWCWLGNIDHMFSFEDNSLSPYKEYKWPYRTSSWIWFTTKLSVKNIFLGLLRNSCFTLKCVCVWTWAGSWPFTSVNNAVFIHVVRRWMRHVTAVSARSSISLSYKQRVCVVFLSFIYTVTSRDVSSCATAKEIITTNTHTLSEYSHTHIQYIFYRWSCSSENTKYW